MQYFIVDLRNLQGSEAGVTGDQDLEHERACIRVRPAKILDSVEDLGHHLFVLT